MRVSSAASVGFPGGGAANERRRRSNFRRTSAGSCTWSNRRASSAYFWVAIEYAACASAVSSSVSLVMKLLATQSARFHFTLSSARSFSTAAMKRCASSAVGAAVEAVGAGGCCAVVDAAQPLLAAAQTRKPATKRNCRERWIMRIPGEGKSSSVEQGPHQQDYTRLEGQMSATTHASHLGARASHTRLP